MNFIGFTNHNSSLPSLLLLRIKGPEWEAVQHGEAATVRRGIPQESQM